jgi:hypothetical protein
MDSTKKHGYSTDDEEEWDVEKLNQAHIAPKDTDGDTDDEDDHRRASAAAAVSGAHVDTERHKALVRIIQNIRQQIARYVLKDNSIVQITDNIWARVKTEGTKQYEAEIANWKKNQKKMKDLDKLRTRRQLTKKQQEELQLLSQRVQYLEKILRRGSLVQNIEERIADINKLFTDGYEKGAIGLAKWLKNMVRGALWGRDIRSYKGGKRKRRTRKRRHRRKRRKTRRRKRSRRRRRK